MSAAVRAALAAKRAEHRSRSSSPTKLSPSLPNDDNELPHFGRDLDASIASPFGSPKPAARSVRASDAHRSSVSPAPEMDLNQKPEEDVVRLSIQTGAYNSQHGRSTCITPPPRHGASAANELLTCIFLPSHHFRHFSSALRLPSIR